MLSTIERSGTMLSLFTDSHPEWGVREASAELDWPRSSTHELLTSLAAIGLLQRTSTSRYRLGWRILALGKVAVHGANLGPEAQSIAFELSRAVRLPVTVATWDGRRVTCVASFAGRSGMPNFARGTRLPGHTSALGKILMSDLTDDVVEECIERYGLPRLTAQTDTRTSSFFRRLRRAQERGIAFDRGETYQNRHCVAAPVRDENGRFAAALSISAPDEVLSDRGEALIASAISAARRISAAGGDAGVTGSLAQATG